MMKIYIKLVVAILFLVSTSSVFCKSFTEIARDYFVQHNYTPADVVYNSVDKFRQKKSIDKYFITKNIETIFKQYFNTVTSYNLKNHSELRTLTYQTTRNSRVRVVFYFKQKRWMPASIFVNNKNIKNSETLLALRNGLPLVEEAVDFPEFVETWNYNNGRNKIIRLLNVEATLDRFYATVAKQQNKILFKLRYTNQGGWKISSFSHAVNTRAIKGNRSYENSKSYDISRFIDRGDDTSPEAYFDPAVRGLVVKANNHNPVVSRITCDLKMRERKIRLAFLLKGSGSVENYLNGYNARGIMRLRLNGAKVTVDQNNCTNLEVRVDPRGGGIDLDLSKFGLLIKGFSYGFGKRAGRSYIDFRF